MWESPVVLSAAMFRPESKPRSCWVIRVCGELPAGEVFHLVIAAHGQEKVLAQKLTEEQLPGRTRFVGGSPEMKCIGSTQWPGIFLHFPASESLEWCI